MPGAAQVPAPRHADLGGGCARCCVHQAGFHVPLSSLSNSPRCSPAGKQANKEENKGKKREEKTWRANSIISKQTALSRWGHAGMSMPRLRWADAKSGRVDSGPAPACVLTAAGFLPDEQIAFRRSPLTRLPDASGSVRLQAQGARLGEERGKAKACSCV